MKRIGDEVFCIFFDHKVPLFLYQAKMMYPHLDFFPVSSFLMGQLKEKKANIELQANGCLASCCWWVLHDHVV